MESDNHQPQRRRFFYGVLGAVFLGSLAVAVLPVAQAEQTVEAGAGDPSVLSLAPEPSAPVTEPPTTSSLVEPTSTTAAPTTTTPKATTTTTKPKPTTTTTKPPKVPAAPPTTAAPRPAAPPPASTGIAGPTAEEAAFLACVRRRESGGNYSIVSSNGLYYGAYQFLRSSWDSTAMRAGRPDLVGVPPNLASPADQDAMALFLYRQAGKAPWGGAC